MYIHIDGVKQCKKGLTFPLIFLQIIHLFDIMFRMSKAGFSFVRTSANCPDVLTYLNLMFPFDNTSRR